MKYLRLLTANLWRKKMRFFLTIGSFAIALFLFGLLTAIYNGFYQGIEATDANRLILRNKISLINFVPYAYKGRIEAVEGVVEVVPFVWFGGVYQDPKNFFPQMAIEPEGFRKAYSEYEISDSEWETFLRDQMGCFVGSDTAERFGFEVGDRIPIKGTIFPGAWEFNVSGIYHSKRTGADNTGLFFHYKYLSETIPFLRGSVGWYTIVVDDPERGGEIALEIDRLFENSSCETKTEPEKLFAISFIKQMGDIKLILMSVGGVVIFTLLLVTGSTMAMAIRERTGELAILKTLGFKDSLILILVMAESVISAALGGLLGLGLASLFVAGGDPTNGLLPSFVLTPGNMIAGLTLTVLTGILAGLVPAINAMNLQIVNALRRV